MTGIYNQLIQYSAFWIANCCFLIQVHFLSYSRPGCSPNQTWKQSHLEIIQINNSASPLKGLKIPCCDDKTIQILMSKMWKNDIYFTHFWGSPFSNAFLIKDH